MTVIVGDGLVPVSWETGDKTTLGYYVFIIDELFNILVDENDNKIYSEFIEGEGDVTIEVGDAPSTGSFAVGDMV